MNNVRAWIPVVVSLAVLFSAGCAFSPKEVPPLDHAGLFDALDKNKDGKISREEYHSIWKDKKKAERDFRVLDKDDNGFVDLEEFQGAGVKVFSW